MAFSLVSSQTARKECPVSPLYRKTFLLCWCGVCKNCRESNGNCREYTERKQERLSPSPPPPCACAPFHPAAHPTTPPFFPFPPFPFLPPLPPPPPMPPPPLRNSCGGYTKPRVIEKYLFMTCPCMLYMCHSNYVYSLF